MHEDLRAKSLLVAVSKDGKYIKREGRRCFKEQLCDDSHAEEAGCRQESTGVPVVVGPSTKLIPSRLLRLCHILKMTSGTGIGIGIGLHGILPAVLS